MDNQPGSQFSPQTDQTTQPNSNPDLPDLGPSMPSRIDSGANNIKDNSNNNKPKKKSKIALLVLAVLLVGAGGFGAAYFWQSSSNSQSANQVQNLEQQVSDLQQQLSASQQEAEDAESEEATAANPDLIPGNVDTSREDNQVAITAVYKYSLEPTEVWIEYGTDPTKLDQESDKVTEDLGAGDDKAVYSSGPEFLIADSKLEAGTTYYYRTVATIDDKTASGPVASFTTAK